MHDSEVGAQLAEWRLRVRGPSIQFAPLREGFWLRVLIGLLLVSGFYAAVPTRGRASDPIDVGYRDFSFGAGGSSTPSGEKPESKLWWNDGFWWGSLYNKAVKDNHIYRFDLASQSWVDTGTALDPRAASKADALWDEASQKLYVVSHVHSAEGLPTPSSSQWGRLYRYTYSRGTQTYYLDAGFPVKVTRGKSETLTLAKDSTGRLWVTYVESQKVMINRSLSSDLDWGEPLVLPASAEAVTVSTDDISSVVAFGGNKIGVMWSNQLTSNMYFAAHLDGDADTVWQAEETALPGPSCAGACADDHINLKSDSSGQVFAAMKTSLTALDSPRVILLKRNVSGVWSGCVFGRNPDQHTRPIVLLDEEHGRLYVFATAPETAGGGVVYVKSTDLNNIQFSPGLGDPSIKSATDTSINNPTSSKQNVSSATGLLVLASDSNTRFYFHNYMSLSGMTSPTVTAFSPASGPEGQAVTITGSSFTGATAVSFNGTPAPSYTIVSDTRIDTTVPTGATTGKVSVTNPAGTGFSTMDFAVEAPPSGQAPPAITSFLPSSGAVGTAVTITGKDFTGATVVAFAGTPAPSFRVVSDTRLDTTVPAGATTGKLGVTNTAGTGFSTSDFTVTPNLSIKDITFEGGSLTDPATGADRISGTVSLETAAPLKGIYSARIPGAANSWLQGDCTAVSNLYVSFYLRVNTLPTSDVRIGLITNAGVTAGNLVVRANGRIRLRNGTTLIGPDSAPLVAGQVYRLAIHQTQGTGSNAVLEGFLAQGDNPFGAPFAATTTGTWTTAADRWRTGATTSVAADIVLDDIKLDAASMPPPSPGAP